MMGYWLLLVLMVSTVLYAINSLYYMQMLQQNSYRPSRYFRWAHTHFNKVIRLRTLLPMVLVVFYYIGFHSWLIVTSLGISILALTIFRERVRTKKKLTFTSRVKRTLFTHGFLYALGVFTILLIKNETLTLTFIGISHIVTFLVAVLSIIILQPVEKAINRYYYQDAKRKLKELTNIKVIGITGSYGKTSTKHIIEKILSRQFQVVMTPGSYNTTLGNVITIREKLNTMTDIYIAEMGAKEVGDIKAICDLVKPDIGVLTSIGPQHLETFKSIDNVVQTKFELIEAVKDQGIAVLNMNNAYIRDNRHRFIPKGVEEMGYGVEISTDIEGMDVEISSKGMSFKVKYQGAVYPFETRLLGSHNINNILAGILIGFKLEMSYKDIYIGVKSIEPVEHRLQLLKKNQYTLIDDAFNSNPEGAQMALEVLQTIKGNNKIIITPGMIELGPLQYEANYNFGKQIAEVCDYVILEGKKQTGPIMEGLLQMNYPTEKIAVVSDIFEAYSHLGQIVSEMDVVLIENDLPDNYNE